MCKSHDARQQGISRSRTPYINVRGRQGRSPSLWEGLWPQRIVGPVIGASGCRWLACLARCLAWPRCQAAVKPLSLTLESSKFLANPSIRILRIWSIFCLSESGGFVSISSFLRFLWICHRINSWRLKLSESMSFTEFRSEMNEILLFN